MLTGFIPSSFGGLITSCLFHKGQGGEGRGGGGGVARSHQVGGRIGKEEGQRLWGAEAVCVGGGEWGAAGGGRAGRRPLTQEGLPETRASCAVLTSSYLSPLSCSVTTFKKIFLNVLIDFIF